MQPFLLFKFCYILFYLCCFFSHQFGDKLLYSRCIDNIFMFFVVEYHKGGPFMEIIYIFERL